MAHSHAEDARGEKERDTPQMIEYRRFTLWQ
jgi:hypothetical protein